MVSRECGTRHVISFSLDSAVTRARAGRDVVRWQGATTLRVRAHEEKQRRQRAAARLARARSTLTLVVNAVVDKNSIFIRSCKR